MILEGNSADLDIGPGAEIGDEGAHLFVDVGPSGSEAQDVFVIHIRIGYLGNPVGGGADLRGC